MKWSCQQLLFLFAVVIFAAHGEIDKKWMKDALQSHFSQPRHHATYPKYKMRAMRFIRDEFREYGLETHLDTFNTRLQTVSGINVIGVLKGKHFNTDDDVIVGVAAHYDTMRDTSGVDDNGAAVVAMLQAAKKVASEPPRNNTVIFAAFDLEEWEDAGFRGYMQNCYHKRCDTMERVTDSMIEFAAKTSRALAATVNQMAPTLPNVNSGHQTFPEVVILFWVVFLAMLPM
ncbi:uncharacterized protein LOC121369659 isoform X2 [Gigantopelta aegis]|uniref:uncharacterized protein LOC121369659 isoform X2 n=1 Tax=Gigantopelta aegis TaxID=1735272 RepID=UPI001B888C64|nr:uncharacterized protein LOC121369659 isoform X2 [Gigantopelta aegis]